MSPSPVSLRIGQPFGIIVYLHWSLFFGVLAISWVIGSGMCLSATYIAQTFGVVIDTTLSYEGAIPYFLGLFIALGFYFSQFIFMIVTSLMARRQGIHTHFIILMIFGGMNSQEKNPPRFRDMLPIALSGPLAFLGLGILSAIVVYAIAPFTGNLPVAGMVIFVFGCLAVLILILFTFSILPAPSTNGGRVLQAGLTTQMPIARARKIVAYTGIGIALLFLILGVITINFILITIGILILLEVIVERVSFKPGRNEPDNPSD